MEEFRRILLVAFQDADNTAAFQRAVARAKRTGAALTVTDVVRAPEWIESSAEFLAEVLWLTPMRTKKNPGPHAHPSLHEIMAHARKERARELAVLAQEAERQGVAARTKVFYGVPFVEITREVMRGGHDLVMMSAEGQRTLGSRIFGRTSMQLMRKCPAPVWVFKPSVGRQHARVLAAVDPAPYDATRAALNAKIVDLAVSIARIDGAALDVLYARGGTERAVETKWFSSMPAASAEKLSAQLRRARREAIDRHLARHALHDLEHAVHVLDGDPGDVIPEFAADRKSELIVMGTVCRTGVAGFFMGNTAEAVLEKVDCSVLALKPDGFVSPVRAGDETGESGLNETGGGRPGKERHGL